MRTFMFGAVVVVLMCGGFLLHRTRHNDLPATSDESAERVAVLEQELANLRQRVGSVERTGGAALGHALSQQAAAGGGPDGAAAASLVKPPASTPTLEEMTKTFKRYFEQLDALRGSAVDVEMTDTFTAALAKAEWRDAAKAGPSDKHVSCGGGYCRVALTFPTAEAAQEARHQLMMAFRDVAKRASIFFDPETLRVEGYFASGDQVFPPFPG
jgi:hypothetical protein